MAEINRTSPVLVTGGGGYIASWVVRELLAEGLSVRATVRSTSDAKKISHLLELGAAYPGMLQLFESNLLVDGSFDEAMRDCGLVMHTASPFFVSGVKDAQKELVEPALQGTRNVLETVNRVASVRRVVLTSSVAAILGDNVDARDVPDRTMNESHWNLSSSLEHDPYSYSKTVAEREAWKIAGAQDRWDLVVINPAFVLGPSLSRRADGTSVGFMKSMAGGEFRFGVPDLLMGVVDVRDVARAHILAAIKPAASGRHLTCAETLTILEMGEILREAIGDRYPFPRNTLPDFLMYLIGPFVGMSWTKVTRNIGVRYKLDRSYSEKDLGLSYRPIRSTLVDHIEQMAAAGMIS
ncbi:MAG: NAD-dependent epimerase/dehydratase family protein [Leptospirales bacterium]